MCVSVHMCVCVHYCKLYGQIHNCRLLLASGFATHSVIACTVVYAAWQVSMCSFSDVLSLLADDLIECNPRYLLECCMPSKFATWCWVLCTLCQFSLRA